MTVNSVVRARMTERTKGKHCALKKIGSRVRCSAPVVVRVAAEKLSLKPLNSNAGTPSRHESRTAGRTGQVGKPNKLLRSLNAGD